MPHGCVQHNPQIGLPGCLEGKLAVVVGLPFQELVSPFIKNQDLGPLGLFPPLNLLWIYTVSPFTHAKIMTLWASAGTQ
jgi:hypothetical protein